MSIRLSPERHPNCNLIELWIAIKSSGETLTCISFSFELFISHTNRCNFFLTSVKLSKCRNPVHQQTLLFQFFFLLWKQWNLCKYRLDAITAQLRWNTLIIIAGINVSSHFWGDLLSIQFWWVVRSFGQKIVSAHSVTEWNLILTHTHIRFVCSSRFDRIFRSSSNCMCSKGKVWASKAFHYFCYEYISNCTAHLLLKRVGGEEFPWNGFHLLALINRTKIPFIHLL